jgi:hypothetical protein
MFVVSNVCTVNDAKSHPQIKNPNKKSKMSDNPPVSCALSMVYTVLSTIEPDIGTLIREMSGFVDPTTKSGRAAFNRHGSVPLPMAIEELPLGLGWLLTHYQGPVIRDGASDRRLGALSSINYPLITGIIQAAAPTWNIYNVLDICPDLGNRDWAVDILKTAPGLEYIDNSYKREQENFHDLNSLI